MNNFFNISIYRNWNLNWYNDLFLNFDNFADFMCNWDNLINIDFSGNFNLMFNDLIVCFLNNFNSADNLLNRHNFLYNFFNDIFFSDVSIDRNFNHFDFLLEHRNLHNLLNLNNLSIFNDSVNYLFNYLWNLDNLLNHSWNYYHFFYNFLYLNYFGNFYHFLYYFVNIYSHLFYSFDNFWNLYNLFHCYLDWIVDCDFDCLYSFDLYDLWNFDDLFHIFFNLNNDWILNFLNNNLSDNLWNSHYFLFNNWHFDSSFHNLLYLSNNFNSSIYNLLHLFNLLFVNNLLLDNFNLLDCWYFNFNFNNLFNYFWYLNDSLDSLNESNWSFVDNFNYFRYSLDMIHDFSGILDLDLFDQNIISFVDSD